MASKRGGHQPKPGPAPALPAHGSGIASLHQVVRIRCPAGNFAIAATEAEVRLDGARIAGGNDRFEFDLAQEAWIEIAVLK